MKRIAPALLYGIYLVLAAIVPTLVGPSAVVLVYAILSAGLILAFAWLTEQRLYVPLVAVFLVTVLVPCVVLVLIGLRAHGSVSGALAALLSTMREHGLLAGFEIVIPFLGAAATSILVRARYNIAMDGDARRPRHH